MLSKTLRLLNSTKISKEISSYGFSKSHKKPVRVAITGAAGNIGYALVYRIANGDLLGKDQPVIIHLIDLPQMQGVLNGVKMEIDDCAFPLVSGVVITDNQSVGFKDVDYALLVGSKPRGPGMERADLLKDNGKIFIDTGKAINDNASRNIKCLVVGNPANTNCLILSHYCKDIPRENFTAMTRLDHNRGLSQLSQKVGCHVNDIKHFAIWGNHSPTMYPDVTHATINGKAVNSLVDHKWINDWFNPKVGKRGAEIIAARKLSSAASAGSAAIDHINNWALKSNGWTSMAVHTDGSYNVPKGLIFSFPVTCGGGKYEIVKGLKVDEYSQSKIDITTKELLEERAAIEHLLK